jgi:hypothetical protein
VARLEAMSRLAAGLEAAHRDFNQLRDLTDQMLSSVPEGAALPPGVTLEIPPSSIAAEMFRHARTGDVCLPGAAPPDFSFRDLPTSIEPAADVVRRDNTWVLEVIRNQIGAAADEAA